MATGRPDRRPISPIGLAFVGSEMVGFTLVGLLIDYLTGWLPWATVTMTLVGLVAALIHLVRMTKAKAGGST